MANSYSWSIRPNALSDRLIPAAQRRPERTKRLGAQRLLDDLPTEVRQESQAAVTGGFKLPAEGISFEEVEKNLILQAMDQTDYNITKAAKLLGLTFRTLQYRLEKFGIKKNDGKGADEE